MKYCHKKTYCLLFAVTAVFIFSCSSIPAPHNEDDTLLIIPVGVINKSNEPWYGSYSFVIESITGGNEVKIKKIQRTEGYTYVSTLPPGEYRIKELVFMNNSKNYDRESRIEISIITFTLEAGTLTVLDKKFLYTIETPMTSGHPIMKPKFVPLSGDGVNEILEELKNTGNFSKWDSQN